MKCPKDRLTIIKDKRGKGIKGDGFMIFLFCQRYHKSQINRPVLCILEKKNNSGEAILKALYGLGD
ncbi:hypothetical protein [Chryseobacterium aureum]|uniref:hypothetical protein n=1 Tax=Chryseobacterium aureum TaxID=2497456 RepID=UPI000F877867|nr:hypothetical protein [Chryseobacterium aureum]